MKRWTHAFPTIMFSLLLIATVGLVVREKKEITPAQEKERIRAIVNAITPAYDAVISFYGASTMSLPEPDDPEYKNAIMLEDTLFLPVLNENLDTMAKLRDATEKAFTKDLANDLFYTRLIPNCIQEVEGRLYATLYDFGGWPYKPLSGDDISVVSFSDERIEYTTILVDDMYPDEKIIQTVILVYQNGNWKIAGITSESQ